MLLIRSTWRKSSVTHGVIYFVFSQERFARGLKHPERLFPTIPARKEEP